MTLDKGPSSGQDYSSLWGEFIKDHMQGWGDEQIQSLAKKVGMPASTLGARVRGGRKPPLPQAFTKIDDELALNEEEQIEQRVAALWDLFYAVAKRQGCQFTLGEMKDLLQVFRQILGPMRKQGRLPAVLFLPFIFKSLIPPRFVAGKLVLPKGDLELHLPPSFAFPVDAQPQFDLMTTYHSTRIPPEIADDVVFDERGYAPSGVLDEILREVLGLEDGHGEHLRKLEDGSLYFRQAQEIPYLSYRCEAGTEVKAVYDGVVKRIAQTDKYASSSPWVEAPRWSNYNLSLDLENGYEVEYCFLSEVKVQEGAIVKRGDTIGLTGKVTEAQRVVQQIDGSFAIEALGYDIEGVNVACVVNQDYFDESSLFRIPVDPGVVCPRPELVVNLAQDDLDLALLLTAWKENKVTSTSFSELLSPDEDLITAHWLHFVDKPYIVMPDNRVEAIFVPAVLLLATSLLSVRLGLKRLLTR